MSLNISEWMCDKRIFITGATGFVGKVLIEKLLNDCDGIEKIYLLIRKKNDNVIEERFKQFKECKIFDRIRSVQPDKLNKLYPIDGDITKKKIGLCENDYQRLKNDVNVIFHCAASVRFNEKLKDALINNTKSTYELLTFAEKLIHLQSLIFVSTAYSNINDKVIKETVYKPIVNYKTVLKACENNDLCYLNYIEEATLKSFPNTYIISKNIAENVVYDWHKSNTVPIAIVRPSIICPAYKEPLLGWVDSLNGPVGVLVAAASGVLRTVHGSGTNIPDLVPVDYVANTCIAAAVNAGCSSNNDCPVYNCTTSAQAPITWNEFLDIGREIYDLYPPNQLFWYPGGNLHSNYLVHMFCFIMFQVLPSLFFDFLLLITGRQPFLLRLQRKINDSLNYYDYFMRKQWRWENRNLVILYHRLSPPDKYKFNFDATKIDYREYITNWILGSRRYLLKLNDNTIKSSRTKLRILFWMDKFLKTIVYGFLFYYLIIFLHRFNAITPVTTLGCQTCTKHNLDMNFINQIN